MPNPPITRRSGPSGPFDACREMIEALDARGRLLRIDRVDQDAYEGTALMYRLVEKHGLEGAPALLFENVKIGGEWLQGPVIGNYLGPWDTECLALGLEPDPAGGAAANHAAVNVSVAYVWWPVFRSARRHVN